MSSARAAEPAPASRHRTALLPLCLLAVGVLAGVVTPGYIGFIPVRAAGMAIAALSLTVTYGRGGMLTLCPMSFVAVGGWTMSLLSASGRLPFGANVLLAGLLTVPVGVVAATLALRLRGAYLAVTTFAFAHAFTGMLSRRPFQKAVPRPLGFRSDRGYFLLSVAVLFALAWGLSLIDRSLIGHRWTMVRVSERAGAAVGLSVPWVKLQAFAAGAFVAGVGGAMMAARFGTLQAGDFNPTASLLLISACIMAGCRGLTGPILAGLVLTVAPQVIDRLIAHQGTMEIVFGIGAVAVLARRSDGLAAMLPWTDRLKWPARQLRASPSATFALTAASTDAGPALRVRGSSTPSPAS